VDAERISTEVLFALINYAAVSTVLLGAAWLIARILSDRFNGLADLLWKGALASSAISPVLQMLVSAGMPGPGPLLPTRLPGQVVHLDAYALDDRISLAAIGLWLTLVCLSVFRLVQSHVEFRTALRSRRALTAAERRKLVGESGDRSYTVSVSSAIQIPIALAGEICIPGWAIEHLSVSELRAVVAHEAAHIRRRDSRWRWMSAVIARVFFFQPLNFVAIRRLCELSECLCDDEAVTHTSSAVDLASALGTFAAAIVNESRRTLVPSLASRESLTVRRVRRILTRNGGRRRLLGVHSELSLAVVVLVLASLSTVAPRVVPGVAPTIPYVVTANDPAGPFTLTLHHGRVLAATVNGAKVPAEKLRQSGDRIDLLVDRSPFTIELKPGGGIAWLPRRAPRPHL
jgi:beta-lactamase regulating signal transducer with metallopeptidase domain